MNGQLDLLAGTGTNLNDGAAYEIIEPALLKVLDEYYVDPKHLQLDQKKNYSSISFQSSLIARLCFRGSNSYFSIAYQYKDLLPFCPDEPTAKDFIRVQVDATGSDFDQYVSVFSEILKITLDRIPKEYDCCSRYLECSNNKKCLHPDKDFALTCGYKKIMASGRIFYGENRNID